MNAHLFGSYTSPFVRHCRVVLAQNDHPHTFTETTPADSPSPTQKVPFFKDTTPTGEIALTDSAAIIFHLRAHHKQAFLQTPALLDQFARVNTALDASITLFRLANDMPASGSGGHAYLVRHESRIARILASLNEELADTAFDPYNDVHLRIVCYLAWRRFRTLGDDSKYTHLNTLLAQADTYAPFIDTAPPADA